MTENVSELSSECGPRNNNPKWHGIFCF